MTRERLVGLLCALVLAAGAWWLSVNTEWVEVDNPRSARGEARVNPVYAFEQLLRRLGMTVAHFEDLPTMPPPRARLVLMSNDWELIPERAEQLRLWVKRGGHLVLLQDGGWDDTALGDWVPIASVDVKPPSRPAAPASASASKPALPVSTRVRADDRVVLASTPPLWGDTGTLATCDVFPRYRKLHIADSDQPAVWTLAKVDLTHAARVTVGQGTVTVLNTGNHAFHNGSALRCDNPLLLAAAVQAEPGATAWIYLNEKREALLPWLWQKGWIAIVGCLLALAAALWRAAVRFGPRLAPAPRLRRSISEQVRGLGAYLHRHGPDALLVAQQRALHEVASKTLPRYARLALAERVQAIAAATGLSGSDIATALSPRFCTRKELPQHLQLLETARRRLHRTPDERHSP